MFPFIPSLFALRQAWHEERGQALVEYLLILVLVAIVVIVVLSLLGTTLSTVWYDLINCGFNRSC
nr:Flp family type IVb pilin [Ardenticatena sp.]